MTNSEQQWFVTERARALAMVHLTRRKDLLITKANREVGLEFLVYITREGKESLRQFGVCLRGAKSPVTEDHLNKVLQPTMESFQKVGPFPYPVCLFHFTMDDDQGYFTWVAEPVVSEGGPQLLIHRQAHCVKLDRTVLDEMVERTNRWYDAFFERIAVAAS